MIFLTHSDCELIHDSAVDTVKVVLGILSDQSQILIRYVESIEIL